MTRVEVQRIADITANYLGISPPTFTHWNPRRGFARTHLRKFSLPRWVRDEPYAYRVAYIVHEVAHFTPHGRTHGREFQQTEEHALMAWGFEVALRAGPEQYAKVLAGPDGEPIEGGRIYGEWYRYYRRDVLGQEVTR